jgi:hypothetical protein
MTHPLLLPESQAHYDNTDKTSNILQFETCNTIAGGLGAISYNMIKYENREKGQNDLDEKKLQTFIAWRELLRDLLKEGYDLDTNIRYAMKNTYPEMRYTLSEPVYTAI